MFTSLEGMARDNAKMIDENGDLHVTCILDGLDSLYGVSMTFQGELARMSKDCFYAGLLPENCPMVVHLKDQPHTTPLDPLRALLEQEENDALTRTHYPLSTSARPSHPPKPAEHYH